MLKFFKKSSIESVFQKVQELFIKSKTSEEMDTQIDHVQVERTQNSLLRPNITCFFTFMQCSSHILRFP